MLLTKIVKIKWNTSNKIWYENKGYDFTKYRNEFYVNVEDLPNGSNAFVEVKCDCPDCITPITKPTKWENYIKYLKGDGKYYCINCGRKLFAKINANKTKLLKSKSFEQWCYDNLSKEEADEILSRWDYDKNIDKDGNVIKPSDISYSSNGFNKKGYWFKCVKHLEHNSELKNIGGFTRRKGKELNCNQCSSFAQNLIDKHGENALELYWDYNKNIIDPWSISYGSSTNIYIKCQNKDYHGSYKVNCGDFIKGDRCGYCSNKNGKVHPLDSFAQYHIDNTDKDFLNKYWDGEKNNKLGVNPWEVCKNSSKTIIYIKCQEKDYHGSYKTSPSSFTGGARCPFCCNFHGKVHEFDSLGQLLKDRDLLHLWSDKNKKIPYKFAPWSMEEVYWKCECGKHEDYIRSINSSNKCEFRCPYCQFSKGEKRIEEYLIKNKIDYIPQHEYEGLIGLGGGNLSYDFCLPEPYNLLIEYQGEQHEKYIRGFHKSKKDFEKQVEHDRRKKEYAENNKINLLPIWYWDFDNIEEILDKEFNNKSSKLRECV